MGKEKIMDALKDGQSWLDSNPEADAEEIKEKHKEVEGICAPIVSKYYGAGGGGGGGGGMKMRKRLTMSFRYARHVVSPEFCTAILEWAIDSRLSMSWPVSLCHSWLPVTLVVRHLSAETRVLSQNCTVYAKK